MQLSSCSEDGLYETTRAEMANTKLYGGKKTVCRNQKGGSDKGAVVSRNEIKETTAANLWGKRAKDLGYKPKPAGYQKYKEYIQMLDG
uniref:Uncharacterized protein n=1 Tax=Physcomitrium patens TaxID=3218 RepID=A0A7I4AGC6_PHYPA